MELIGSGSLVYFCSLLNSKPSVVQELVVYIQAHTAEDVNRDCHGMSILALVSVGESRNSPSLLYADEVRAASYQASESC